MPKNRVILLIGLFIGLEPIFLGFPKWWEDFFQVVGGFGIVALSIMISIDRRLSQKAKAQKRLARRREKVQHEAEALTVSPPGNEGAPQE